MENKFSPLQFTENSMGSSENLTVYAEKNVK